MRILHIVSRYDAEHPSDGISAAVGLIIKGLRRCGSDMTVFSISPDVARGTERVVDSVEGVRHHYFHAWPGSRFDVSAGLLRSCRRRIAQFDVVHIHGLWRFPTAWGALACRRAGVPYVLSPHGMLNDWAFRHRRHLKLPLWYAIERRTIRAATRLHFTTEAELANARAWASPDRSAVIPIGVDVGEFDASPVTAQVRASLGVAPDAFVLGFLGRIHPIKGLRRLLEAMVQVKAEMREPVLVVAGPDHEGHRAELEALASELRVDDCVRWIGPIYGRKKLEFLKAIDLFVLPSFSENFGIAAVEAMAAGRAVLLGEGVDIADRVERANAGWRVATEQGSLATAILSASRDLEDLRRRGELGRRLVMANYSIDASARRMMTLYQVCRRGPLIVGTTHSRSTVTR